MARGRVMELNRYPENYFAEVEQAAFSPANIVRLAAVLVGQAHVVEHRACIKQFGIES